MTHTYTRAIKQPTLDYLTRSVCRKAASFKSACHHHGFPVVVPHLYAWKTVKWVRGVELLEEEVPGFWEQNGYHIYGDPFREERQLAELVRRCTNCARIQHFHTARDSFGRKADSLIYWKG